MPDKAQTRVKPELANEFIADPSAIFSPFWPILFGFILALIFIPLAHLL